MNAGLAWAAGWERDVLHWVTCRWDAPWLAGPLDALQRPWTGVGFLLAGCLLVAVGNPRRGLRTLLAAALAVGLALSLGTGRWHAVERPRPGAVYEEVLRTPEERATCAARPHALALHSHGSRRPSFPSHHALTAGAIAAVLTAASTRLSPLAWLLALVVGYARLYFGKHWPTDVLGGLAIGAAVGALCWRWVPWLLGRLGLSRLREAPPPHAEGGQE